MPYFFIFCYLKSYIYLKLKVYLKYLPTGGVFQVQSTPLLLYRTSKENYTSLDSIISKSVSSLSYQGQYTHYHIIRSYQLKL